VNVTVIAPLRAGGDLHERHQLQAVRSVTLDAARKVNHRQHKNKNSC
jgi:hypothetical protein